LKEVAPSNIFFISDTKPVFQVLKSLLKTVAPENIDHILVTECVSHEETFGFAEVAP